MSQVESVYPSMEEMSDLEKEAVAVWQSKFNENAEVK